MVWNGYQNQSQQQGQVGLDQTFEQCIEVENARINAIGQNLLDFSQAAGQSEDLERIYASLCEAYNAGVAANDEYRHKLTELSYLEQGYRARMSAEQKAQIEDVPEDKQAAVFHLIGGMICCLERPTDEFRRVLTRHQKDIFNSLIDLAKNSEISAQDFYQNVKYIVNLLCLFDIAKPSGAGMFWSALAGSAVGFVLGSESDFKPLRMFGGGDDD